MRPPSVLVKFSGVFSRVHPPLVTAALRRLGVTCIQPTGPLHGAGVDALSQAIKQHLHKLCASGIVGLAFAAPPCAAYLLVRLKRGDLKPVRPPEHPDGPPQFVQFAVT